MAETVVIARISTDDFSGLDVLDRAIEAFGPGDLGQITIPLDPEIALDEEFQNFRNATNALNGELSGAGLRPWSGRTRIAELDWNTRSVRLLFQGKGTVTRRPDISLVQPGYELPFRYATTPSVFAVGIFANLVRGTAMTIGRQASFSSLGRATNITIRRAGASFGSQRLAIQSARAAFKAGTRAARLGARVALPRLSVLVVGGGLIFFALAPGKFMEALKWVGSKVGEAAKDVADEAGKAIKEAADAAAKAAADAAKKAGQALGEGIGKIGLVAVGGVLIVGGVYLFMRRK
jgi:hypothetical protein